MENCGRFFPSCNCGSRPRVGGLTADLIVHTHQIRTVSKGRVKRTIGYLTDPDRRRAAHNALSLHLELYWTE